MNGTRNGRPGPPGRRAPAVRANAANRQRQNGSAGNAHRNHERYLALAREAALMATRSRPRTFISTPSTTFESRGSERIDVCNLYSLNKNRDTVGRFFRVSHNRIVSFEPSSGIFPRHVAPVVRRAADGEREIVLMNWGFFRLEKGRAPEARDQCARRSNSDEPVLA
jgi:hypothetical protein